MSRPDLRTVKPGEIGEPATPPNITEALSGSSRDVHAAMRSALAKRLDKGEIAGNSIAAAYKELREIDRLIRIADAEATAEGKRVAPGERRSFDPKAI